MTGKLKYRFMDKPPEIIPIEELRYSITPQLVKELTYAHAKAGHISSMRFSHYGKRKLDLQAKYERIANMVFYTAESDITPEEVSQVLAGNVLPPRKRIAMEFARISGVLCDAVDGYCQKYTAPTPEICETYLQFARGGAIQWAGFVVKKRGIQLEIPRGSIEIRESVSGIYEWINKDALVSDEPILRAATVFWYLSTIRHARLEKTANLAIMAHELRVGGIDNNGWMMLKQRALNHSALRPWNGLFDPNNTDLTHYFEEFAYAIGDVLSDVYKYLCELQDDAERLPWLTVRPPDELDRQIFDVIESFGKARTQQILGQISDPPPLRTLQRRLQKLCRNGLLTKHGSRRDAYYQITCQY